MVYERVTVLDVCYTIKRPTTMCFAKKEKKKRKKEEEVMIQLRLTFSCHSYSHKVIETL